MFPALSLRREDDRRRADRERGRRVVRHRRSSPSTRSVACGDARNAAIEVWVRRAAGPSGVESVILSGDVQARRRRVLDDDVELAGAAVFPLGVGGGARDVRRAEREGRPRRPGCTDRRRRDRPVDRVGRGDSEGHDCACAGPVASRTAFGGTVTTGPAVSLTVTWKVALPCCRARRSPCRRRSSSRSGRSRRSAGLQEGVREPSMLSVGGGEKLTLAPAEEVASA